MICPEPLSVQEYKLVFSDPTATGGTREAVLTYTVAPYANYTLPDPIWKETFDDRRRGHDAHRVDHRHSVRGGWQPGSERSELRQLPGLGRDLAGPRCDHHGVERLPAPEHP